MVKHMSMSHTIYVAHVFVNRKIVIYNDFIVLTRLCIYSLVVKYGSRTTDIVDGSYYQIVLIFCLEYSNWEISYGMAQRDFASFDF